MPRPRLAPRGQGVARRGPARAPRPASLLGRRPGGARPFEKGGGHVLVADLAGLLLELGDDAQRVAVLAVAEVLVGGLAPAVEVTVDGEQLLRSGERVGRVVGTLDLADLDTVDDRAEAGLGVVGLGLRAGHELEERLGGVTGVDGHRGRVLDEQGVRRQHVVDVGAVLLGQDRLVLVGEEDVTAAVGEGRGGLATAAREGDGVVEQLGQERLGVVLAAAVAGDVGPGREDVPAGRAGRAGVRGDDLDAGLDQVVPGLDALGVALADHEDDDRGGGDAVGGVVLPVVGDEALVDQTGHVGPSRE